MSITMMLTAKGQFTINKTFLEHLGVKAGEKVVVKKLPDGGLKIEAEKNQNDIMSLAGIVKTKIHLTDENIDQAIEQGYINAGMSGLK